MSPHRKKGIAVTRLTGILLLVLLLVTVTGIFTYKSYTGIISGIKKEIIPDFRLLIAEELKGSISDAELSVKSYNITRDTMYLGRFQYAVEQTEVKLEELNEASSHVDANHQAFRLLDSLLEEKIDVLSELLIISDKFRADTALSKVELEIKTKVDSMVIDPDAEDESNKSNKKFFQWLADRRRAKRDSYKEKDNVQVLEEITSDIQKVKDEEREIANEMKSKEFELMLRDEKISTQIISLLDQMRENEMKNIARETKSAQTLIDRTNKQIAYFFFSIAILIVILTYFFLSYVRNSRQYRTALKNAKNEAQELAKTKERFLANMSHEIRTPMNAIFGFTEQIAKGPLTDAQKEQINIVQKSTSHLLTLVNDILDFSKLQVGELKLQKKQFNIYALVNEIIELMKSASVEKGIELRSNLSANLPPVLVGDDQRLRQILINLVSNAIKFTDKGSVEINIDHKELTTDETLLQIEVKDTGIGMSKRQQTRVFKEFEQGAYDTSRNYGGTGLGLSIVKMLTELKHGNISVESKVKKGTSVYLNIPYAIPAKIELPESDNIEAFSSSQVDLGKLKILGVDDEEFNRKLLENILSAWDCDFELASSGEMAIELAKENDFDVILMDARMPGLNGLETTKVIKEKGSNSSTARFIALTAAVSIEDRAKYKKYGMHGFLAKPFSENQLKEKIIQILSVPESIETENEADVETNKKKNMSTDFSHLLEICDGDQEFFKEMLETFVSSSKEAFETIDIGLKANDWELVADQAHKIAPPATHIGADALYNKLKSLEETCRDESSNSKKIEKLIGESRKMLQEVISQVEEELKSK